MKSFKKNYIGKGIQVENMDIVKVTLKVEEIIQHKHEFKGKEYVTFEVAKMQKPDDFDRSHTAYITTTKETQEKETSKKK
ncbi:MAG: hypothetical protein HQ522_15675 [Bacteroidetes bacterium]|nr:hypothetical protein [Bacteroidota bacterium]